MTHPSWHLWRATNALAETGKVVTSPLAADLDADCVLMLKAGGSRKLLAGDDSASKNQSYEGLFLQSYKNCKSCSHQPYIISLSHLSFKLFCHGW